MNIEYLLQKVSAINKKYENIEAITGDKFNVFKILKVESNEVKTHSAFIAELLNPRGCHALKDIFLKAFIHCFKIEEVEEFKNLDTTHAEVEVEESFKFGRIDIVIKLNKGKVIVIENKIYAADQDMQLVRYKDCYSKCHLIYLTLYGTEPSDLSITKSNGTKLVKNTEYYTNSYKEHVLNWLMLCRKEAANFPLLRETLTQYINLIKLLTHQTMNEQQENEIIETVLKSSENIEAAENVSKQWNNIQYEIINRLKNEIEKVGEKFKLKVQIDVCKEYPKLGNVDSGFWFYKDNWKYCIYFCFVEEFEILVGIDVVDSNHSKNYDLKKDLDFALMEIGRNENYDGWLWVKPFDGWNEMGWEEILTKVPEKIEEAVQQFHDSIEKLLSTNLVFKKEWEK